MRKRVLCVVVTALLWCAFLPLGAFADDNGRSADGRGAVVSCGGQVLSDAPLRFQVVIPTDGSYTFGMSYKALGTEIGALEVGLQIDGAFPFAEAEKLVFPRMWRDEGENRKDGLGNEFAARQVPYEGYRFNIAADTSGWTAEPYVMPLTAGTHEITLTPVTGSLQLDYLAFGMPEQPPAYQQPDGGNMYSGAPIIIEGEKAAIKSSYWLSAKTDNASASITPNSTQKSLVNYIGGGNWKQIGDTVIWETPELPEGYYQLGFSFRQSAVMGGKTYRKLTVDGRTPFAEAQSIGFQYGDGWQQAFFANDKNTPYLIHLSAGKHEIALTAVPGDTAKTRDLLRDVVNDLGALYVDITMITGETVDIYRDYDLFAQIPNMESSLNSILKKLQDVESEMQRFTGQRSSSHISVVKNMTRVISQMLNNRYSAHRYKNEYFNRYTAVASVLYDMRDMPLDIDKLALTAPGQKTPFEKTGVLSQLWFSTRRFFLSFIQDYNNVSGTAESEDAITIWVNWGRDQAQVLNSLTQTSFTPQTGVSVNIQLVNASIVQAILSGKAPDCILQHSRSEPVNLAMRGVLYNLREFDDLDGVLARFQQGAETPYRYKDGLYALPDTQTFYLMFYRKDVLDRLELTVPQTWDEFRSTIKLLARRNLHAWLPNNPVTDINQVNAGIGSSNLFPSLLLQNKLSLYEQDGRRTNLSHAGVIQVFNEYTDFYQKYKLPRTMDFYNRFRTGTCPIGIAAYTLYTTLKAAAPEIDGLWGVAPIPGTKTDDGTINHASSGGGTACAILKATNNPDAAWKFLKWWTDSETQLAYSNEVESVLGPAGRVALSNVEAFKGMDWDSDMLESILAAWSQVEEIPEYPGSYYVSRSVYQSFWNVVDGNQNPKDMLLKYGKQADAEIARKWKQYESRNLQ